MLRRISLVAVLALFSVVSCDQQPVGPAADQVAEAPALNFMGAPSDPGNSDVSRFLDILWTWTSDPIGGAGTGSDLRAYQWLANDAVSCGGESDVILWDVQTNAKGNTVAHFRGEPVVIYRDSEVAALCPSEPTDPNDPDYPPTAACCDYLTNQWLYKGTHDATSTLTNWYGGGAGAFVFQYMGNGIVYDQAGTAFQYRDKQKGMLGPHYTWFRFTHEKITVW